MSVRILKHLPSSLLLGLCLSLPSAYLFAEDDILGQFLEHNLFTSSDPIEIFAESPIHPTNTQTITGGLILSSQSALVVNNKTGQILYQKNADRIMPIASISKLMAAMVVLDARLDMGQTITITEAEIDRLKGTGSRLSVGTELTRTQLLHLGLMSSENRAIHALARTYPGGMSAFVQAMNAKAQSLGMRHTRFYEPTGLDPRNVSTASDLLLMAQAADRYPQIRQFSTARSGQVYTSAGRVQQYQNSNALVREGRWNISVQKTGYIREAGRSMVLKTQMGRDPIIMVVLGSSTSTTRVNDARTLGSMVSQYPL